MVRRLNTKFAVHVVRKSQDQLLAFDLLECAVKVKMADPRRKSSAKTNREKMRDHPIRLYAYIISISF